AVGHGGAVGGDRQPATGIDVAVFDKSSAVAVRAEAVRLELADDLEGERIVELGHVDVARAQPGGSKGVASGRATHIAGGHIRATEDVPRRSDLVGGPVGVAGPTED